MSLRLDRGNDRFDPFSPGREKSLPGFFFVREERGGMNTFQTFVTAEPSAEARETGKGGYWGGIPESNRPFLIPETNQPRS